MPGGDRIVVLGLGYVGLPLAVALARNFDVTGFDIDHERVAGLQAGYDRTAVVSPESLGASTIRLTGDPAECRAADIYIVTVPTPLNGSNEPDLSWLLDATRIVAESVDASLRPTIVYESTVYPGVTEDVCGPEIERVSGLKRGQDFRLGYSPERVNPGDPEHTIDKIPKVVAGEDPEVTDLLARVYGSITSGGTFKARSIRTAEAAKAIENAQRDINIAFVNEVAQIVSRLGISVWDVLDAARTKWNFLDFQPGLVGGHCIGVDPYYMSYLATRLGHHPQVILAGRETNDGMGRWVADQLHLRRGKPGTALVLGLTFKENVPDLRNSRSFDLVARLQELGHEVSVSDPIADGVEVSRNHGLALIDPGDQRFDLVVGAVAHQAYREMGSKRLEALVSPGGTLADLRGMWRTVALHPDVDRWTL